MIHREYMEALWYKTMEALWYKTMENEFWSQANLNLSAMNLGKWPIFFVAQFVYLLRVSNDAVGGGIIGPNSAPLSVIFTFNLWLQLLPLEENLKGYMLSCPFTLDLVIWLNLANKTWWRELQHGNLKSYHMVLFLSWLLLLPGEELP